MELDMAAFGKRIVAARERRHWNQQDLVRRSGIRQNLLSALECGHKPSVRADTVLRLAAALRVSTDYLLTGKPATRTRPRTPAAVG